MTAPSSERRAPIALCEKSRPIVTAPAVLPTPRRKSLRKPSRRPAASETVQTFATKICHILIHAPHSIVGSTQDGFDLRPIPWQPDGMYIDGGPQNVNHPPIPGRLLCRDSLWERPPGTGASHDKSIDDGATYRGDPPMGASGHWDACGHGCADGADGAAR